MFLLKYNSHGTFRHPSIFDIVASPAELFSEGEFHILYLLEGQEKAWSTSPLDEKPLTLTTACIDCGYRRVFVMGTESAASAQPLFRACPKGCFEPNMSLGGHIEVFYYFDGDEYFVEPADALVPHLTWTDIFAVQSIPPAPPDREATMITSDLMTSDGASDILPRSAGSADGRANLDN